MKRERSHRQLRALGPFGQRTSTFLRTTGTFLLAWLLVWLSGGCAGYRLGPANGLFAREKSIQITPFANDTLQPRLTDVVTSQLRKEVQRDGTFNLATRGEGDILLTGSLTRYQRIDITYAANDILTVRDYQLTLTAQVTARERLSGRLLLDQPVVGRTLMRVGSDLVSAERQAMPLLAADLARNVTALLAEGKW